MPRPVAVAGSRALAGCCGLRVPVLDPSPTRSCARACVRGRRACRAERAPPTAPARLPRASLPRVHPMSTEYVRTYPIHRSVAVAARYEMTKIPTAVRRLRCGRADGLCILSYPRPASSRRCGCRASNSGLSASPTPHRQRAGCCGPIHRRVCLPGRLRLSARARACLTEQRVRPPSFQTRTRTESSGHSVGHVPLPPSPSTACVPGTPPVAAPPNTRAAVPHGARAEAPSAAQSSPPAR